MKIQFKTCTENERKCTTLEKETNVIHTELYLAFEHPFVIFF